MPSRPPDAPQSFAEIGVHQRRGRNGAEPVPFLWLRVNPAELAVVGEQLSAHPAVRYLVATTGEYQMVADVLLPSKDALYRFLTDVSTSVAALKRASVRRDHLRLMPSPKASAEPRASASSGQSFGW